MAKHMVKPVAVTADSDLMHLLDEADASASVLLERRGVVYRLSTVEVVDSSGATDAVDSDVADEDRIGNDHGDWNPEAIRRNLDETLGSWADIDTDKLIQDIYRWRREGSRNPDEIVP